MSDSAAFVMTMTIAAVGCLLYTAIYRLAEIIKDKNLVRINNFGIKRSEMDDGFAVKFDGEKWVRTDFQKDE